MQDQLDTKVTNGPEGTVADRTLKSIQMISSGISALVKPVSGINPDYKINLHACLTMDVKNLHTALRKIENRLSFVEESSPREPFSKKRLETALFFSKEHHFSSR